MTPASRSPATRPTAVCSSRKTSPGPAQSRREDAADVGARADTGQEDRQQGAEGEGARFHHDAQQPEPDDLERQRHQPGECVDGGPGGKGQTRGRPSAGARCPAPPRRSAGRRCSARAANGTTAAAQTKFITAPTTRLPTRPTEGRHPPCGEESPEGRAEGVDGIKRPHVAPRHDRVWP